MKTISLSVVTIFFPLLVMAQFVFMDPGNADLVMEKLFDGKMNAQHEVVWKPDFNEKFNFQVSDDGKCYTKIDTIFNYLNYDHDKFILYVFSTIRKENGEYRHAHIDVPNISVALFEEGKYQPDQLVAFNKHLTDCGAYGFTGGIKLVKIGKNRFGLQFLYCYLNAGLLKCSTRIFEATYLHFPRIFSLVMDVDNTGAETNKNKKYKFSSELKFVSTEKDHDDIVVTSNGTWLNDNKKIVPVIQKRLFRYNTNTYSYTMIHP